MINIRVFKDDCLKREYQNLSELEATSTLENLGFGYEGASVSIHDVLNNEVVKLGLYADPNGDEVIITKSSGEFKFNPAGRFDVKGEKARLETIATHVLQGLLSHPTSGTETRSGIVERSIKYAKEMVKQVEALK